MTGRERNVSENSGKFLDLLNFESIITLLQLFSWVVINGGS